MMRYGLSVVLAVFLSFSAFADDVSRGIYSKNSKFPEGMILIVTRPDQTVSFSYCQNEKAVSECRRLGSKDSYTIRELQYLDYKLKGDANRVLKTDASHLLIAAGVVAVGVMISGDTSTGMFILKIALGATTSTASVIKGYIFPDANNPRTKYKVAKIVNVQNQDVYVNEPILELAKKLDEALKLIF